MHLPNFTQKECIQVNKKFHKFYEGNVRFIEFFTYLPPLFFIYTQCKSLKGASPYKKSGVPEASAHHGNTKINMCTNFTSMVCKFENSRSSARGHYLLMFVMETQK